EIIPLGEISAGVVSFVTSTFVITASLLGLPTPYVQFATFAVFGVSVIKDGIGLTTGKTVVRKVIFAWFLIPILTVILSYFLHIFLLYRG
ncbi:MAG: hypothetical protein NC824_03120, partial [Candidatus Omnitrophica bacterium]|nr:hypothetical protein [Candidatus Omnitrophota bacterium]